METIKDEILIAIESMKISMDTWKHEREECAQRLKELEESVVEQTSLPSTTTDIKQAYDKIDETFSTLMIGIVNTLGNAIHFLGQVNTQSVDLLSIQTHFLMIKQIFFDQLHHLIENYGSRLPEGYRIVPPPMSSSLTEVTERDWNSVIKSLSDYTWKYRKNLSSLRSKMKYMNNTDKRKALVPLEDTKQMMCIVRDIHRDIANGSPQWNKWMDTYVTATLVILVANTDPTQKCDVNEKDLRKIIGKYRP